VMYLLHMLTRLWRSKATLIMFLFHLLKILVVFLFWILWSIFLTTCHCLFLLCVWLAGINRLILKGMCICVCAPRQYIPRWDKADVNAYYHYCGTRLVPLISELDIICSVITVILIIALMRYIIISYLSW